MQIEHIAIWTHNLEKLKAFYETYFDAVVGAKYINPRTHFESVFLSFASGARLEIMQMPAIPESLNDADRQFVGLIHLAFSVESEEMVNVLTTRLVEAGYRVVSQPRRTGDGYYESCVLDPDNNRVEIVA
jgi:lactoylglutathione lyase